MTRPPRQRRRPSILPLLLLQIWLVGLYADAMPVFEGPDAEGHLAYVAELQDRPLAKPRLDSATAARSHQLIQQPPLYYLAVAAQLLPGQAAALRETFALNPYYPGLSHRVSRAVQQPALPGSPVGPIAAWVSLLGALLCTAATYALVGQLPFRRPGLAILAAAIVALNPQFLHAAATVTNDAWSAGLGALGMALALRAGRLLGRGGEAAAGGMGWARAGGWGLLTGAVLGAAMLTKYSALVLALPAALFLAGALHSSRAASRPVLAGPGSSSRSGRPSPPSPLPQNGWGRGRSLGRYRGVASALVAMVLGMGLVAGPWFLANWRATGEWVPLAAMRQLLPDLFRAEAMGWSDAALAALWAGRSYWGVFGHGFVAPAGFFLLVHGFILGALLGCWRGVRGRPAGGQGFGHRLRRFGPLLAGGLAVWPLLTLAAFLRWVRTVHFANQGRLLLGMAPVVALVLAWGWLSLPGSGRRRWALGTGLALWTGLGLGQIVTLWQAFQPPPALADARPQLPLPARFDGGLELLGLDLASGDVEEGQPIRLRLYWRADQAIGEDAMLYVHAVDAAGAKLAAEDRVPLAGRHPTTAWRPGEVFAEDWRLPVGDVARPELVDLVLGAYRGTDPSKRLTLRDGAGRSLGTELRLAQLFLRPRDWVDPPCPLEAGPLPAPARWPSGIRLDAWGLRQGPGAWPRELRLCWSAVAAPRRDWRLFIHVLDAEGGIVAQWDGQPRQGDRPVSTWARGARVSDSIRLSRPPEVAPLTAERLIIGWYDPVSGQRELLADGADHVELWRRGTLTQLPSPSSSK